LIQKTSQTEELTKKSNELPDAEDSYSEYVNDIRVPTIHEEYPHIDTPLKMKAKNLQVPLNISVNQINNKRVSITDNESVSTLSKLSLKHCSSMSALEVDSKIGERQRSRTISMSNPYRSKGSVFRL
jgi:hypothetical protein